MKSLKVYDMLLSKLYAGLGKRRTARDAFELRIEMRKIFADIFMVILGIISAGFGLKGFLLPNNFLDGGATGISLLIREVTGVSLSFLLIIVNFPFIILAYKIIGRRFAFTTAFAITGLALSVAFLPYPEVTNDKLLIAVFGGFFLGAGIGLSVRGGAVMDGTEVLAIALSKKSGLTIGDVIMIVNVFIFASAAMVTNIETALYAMLTYLSASKTVDFIIEGIEEYTAVTIVSIKEERIRNMIIHKMGRGVTIYKGDCEY